MSDIGARIAILQINCDEPTPMTPTWMNFMATAKIDPSLIQTLTDGSQIIQLGEMEIWDGADLALLRESLMHVFQVMKSRHFGVDMSYVKYVPSGFFGMLYDWHDMHVCIRLYSPQPQIMKMLWFRKFFQPVADGVYQLNSTCPAAGSAPAPNVKPFTTAPMPNYQPTA
jgi:hypothetical protein